VTITQPVQANAVFARIPAVAVPALQEQSFFYVWNASDPSYPEVRRMCSFDTAPEEVEAFAQALRRVLGGQAASLSEPRQEALQVV
jgi:threonine aldolase